MPQNTTINLWNLPQSLYVSGCDIHIRTDFRVVLDLLTALSDPDMSGETPEETNQIKALLTLEIMVPNYEDVLASVEPAELINAICDFIDMSISDEIDDDKPHPRTMDWEQDARLIIPAVNKVIGHDIRAEKYMHWWTFLAAYMEIGECTFSHILSIRNKKARGKKLEKWEQEYIRENKNLVLLKEKKSEEDIKREQAEKEALKKLLHGGG